MNGEDAIAEKFARDEEPRRAPPLLGGLRAEPLLPDAGAAGGSLIAVITVMAFLAVLSVAAYVFISQASDEWTDELKRGLTIQVKGESAEAIEAEVAAALDVLRSTPGVIEATAMSADEAARLLEPWLGGNDISAYVNIPALIEVRVDENLRADTELLRARLEAAAPGAVLDDHGAWQQRLSTAARKGQLVAGAVLALVLAAAAAVTIFAARAGLAANHDVVAILHLVGATDGFIAAQVQRRFVSHALKGSLAGLALALVVLWLMASGAGEADAAYLPALRMDWVLVLACLTIPLLLSLTTAMTARLTVLAALGREL